MYISCKQIDLLMSFRSATVLRVWQYVPVAFLFVPLTLAGYVACQRENKRCGRADEISCATLARASGPLLSPPSLPGAVSIINPCWRVTPLSARFHDATTALTMRLMTAGLSAHAAQQQALARMYALVQSQPRFSRYVEVYWLLAIASAVMFVASFLLKRNEPGKRENVSVTKFKNRSINTRTFALLERTAWSTNTNMRITSEAP